ncbi:MAG: hypothetical protein LBU30_03310 [Candidatus Methanoplasma sp.]|jgi:ABC-type nitrate/sulfonate/bicarbonate transport system substrate-binding protein|nr:hypothetical protein [Candidatus Methanoplasma sp.]
MDKKIIVAAIVAILVIAGIGIYAITSDSKEKDSSYTLLAVANSEGSGLYIKENIFNERGGASAFYTDEGNGIYTVDESNKAAWGGLIFGTPGTTSIQHVQLRTIAEEYLGLNYTLYQENTQKNSQTVYYVPSVSNATAALSGGYPLDGGILWQPQYQAIVDSTTGGFTELALTNNLFPGHTCCVVAGSTSFIGANTEVTERFLAAYVKGALWVQSALADTGSDDYARLVEISKSKTSGLSEEVIKESLSTITYLYGNQGQDDPLTSLRTDIAALADSLQLEHTVEDLGFADSKAFADRFVNSTYLKAALEGVDKLDSAVTVKVAVITGDLHQIALHVAVENGYFNELGINVETSGATNGAGVAVALQNGTVVFGLLGAPPATSTIINGELIKA